ncbi:mandelate racemase/muconate lactonizing enzyme family protein [Paenibacillus solisilvae]|uniref:Mandelate racemase/muconate lactonizing enzyme family protein n=1 Tax=Paenibacillus solisilvae TaxID=2486751 RepID=A0ABW0VXG8_9BACL
MKITKVEAVPVCVPRLKTMKAFGGTITASDFAIVFIDTDEGLQGLGEISMNVDRNGRSLSRDVNEIFAPLLIGQDPLQVHRLSTLIDKTILGSGAAKSGVEMALMDLAGKALNAPVYQLLGGKCRDEVSVTWGFPYGNPEETAEEALEWVEKGFMHLKFKVGRPGTGLDQATLHAVRKRVGNGPTIRVDANTAYSSPLEAVQEIIRMEEFGLLLVEQPVEGRRIDFMAQIRQRITTPLMADESMYHWKDAVELAKWEAADVLSIYISESGGVLSAWKAFAIAEAAGMPGLIGSQCEMGIATAAQLHLAVSIPEMKYASDITGPLRYPDTLVEQRFEYRNGFVKPPEGIGLGVTLDREKFNYYRSDR